MSWNPQPLLVDGRSADTAVTAPEAQTLIGQAIGHYGRRIALVSSFGAESAVLLHMVAQVDPATPVIFLDTYQLFGETLDYRRDLVDFLGLTDVRDVTPAPADLAAEDPDGTLWRRDPDRCCHIRKVLPLERALVDFDAWFTGRKQHHGGDRHDLPPVESDGRRTKFNPLATWTPQDIERYFEAHNLPRHPLLEQGYLSIGCAPCTQPVSQSLSEQLSGTVTDARAGRWQGRDKTECGIHAGYWDKRQPSS